MKPKPQVASTDWDAIVSLFLLAQQILENNILKSVTYNGEDAVTDIIHNWDDIKISETEITIKVDGTCVDKGWGMDMDNSRTDRVNRKDSLKKVLEYLEPFEQLPKPKFPFRKK